LKAIALRIGQARKWKVEVVKVLVARMVWERLMVVARRISWVL
jgi:hypothetical protein